MKTSPFFALLLALPLAAAAQTTPTTAGKTTTPASKTTTTTAPATQQQTEVTEDLDPVTGKVIRRTTRTINVPVGTPAAPSTTAPSTTSSTSTVASAPATDAQVTTFLRRKTAVAALNTTGLLNAYEAFTERVHTDRQSWTSDDWTRASNVLSRLNARYEQLRGSFSFDDKITIRTQQAEYQALRTGRQLSDQVSDKL